LDAGPATNSGSVAASGLAVDSSGRLLIADSTQRIRKVSTEGIISTVAGLGVSVGGSGPAPGDGGPAMQAPLYAPTGVAVDSAGAIYIADTFNSRLRRISADGTITTVAGKGSAGNIAEPGLASDAFVFWPSGLAVDGSGNLYIADCGDSR